MPVEQAAVAGRRPLTPVGLRNVGCAGRRGQGGVRGDAVRGCVDHRHHRPRRRRQRDLLHLLRLEGGDLPRGRRRRVRRDVGGATEAVGEPGRRSDQRHRPRHPPVLPRLSPQRWHRVLDRAVVAARTSAWPARGRATVVDGVKRRRAMDSWPAGTRHLRPSDRPVDDGDGAAHHERARRLRPPAADRERRRHRRTRRRCDPRVGPDGRSREGPASSGRPGLPACEHLQERAHAEAGAAAGDLGLVGVLVEGGSGDVEVGPRHAVGDEVAEEQPGVDGSAVAVADVLAVGDLRLDAALLDLRERHRPHRLAGFVGGGADGGDEVVVVAEEPGGAGAEGDDARPGQRGEVDDGVGAGVVGARLGGPGDGVAEDQAAFGVGVQHLGRRAAVVADDVADACGVAAEHVVGEGQVAPDPDADVAGAAGRQDAEHRGGAGHVALHGGHALGGLDREPAGVEGHALADEGDRRGRAVRLRRVVGELDEPRRLRRAAVDGEQAAEAELPQGGVVVDRARDTGGGGDLGRPVGERPAP